jgi:hypothetical protein
MHRPNYKLDNVAVIAHLRRSVADRDREREEAMLEFIARLVVAGIAGTFLAILWLL